MDLIDQLIAHFKNTENKVTEESPAGTCSVCWGYQEYDAKIRTIFQDKQIDISNHQDSYMKIKKFVVEHIDGIKLKEGKIESCPTCGGQEYLEKHLNIVEQKKPIKRHQALRPLSRQHHHSLLFSWKLRKGFSENIEIERLQKYASWFYKQEMQPHFIAEEKFVFPILGNESELVQQALKDHRRITRLFLDTENPSKSLSILEEELDSHIRFEERILFNEIQKVANTEQLQKIAEIHEDISPTSEYSDAFWE